MRHSRIADRGTEPCKIYPETTQVTSRGRVVRVPDMANPVTINVSVVTGRQMIAEVSGQLDVKVLNCMARTAPVGTWALVEFRGETWDLNEPPSFSQGISRATDHVEFTLRSRNRTAATAALESNG